jgi:hypothetical protein
LWNWRSLWKHLYPRRRWKITFERAPQSRDLRATFYERTTFCKRLYSTRQPFEKEPWVI